MVYLCCSSFFSQDRSWGFNLGKRETEAGLEQPWPEAEHLPPACYTVQHTVRGNANKHTQGQNLDTYLNKTQTILIHLKSDDNDMN